MGDRDDIQLAIQLGSRILLAISSQPLDLPMVRLSGQLALEADAPFPDAPPALIRAELEANAAGPSLQSLLETRSRGDEQIDDEGSLHLELERLHSRTDESNEAFAGRIRHEDGDTAVFFVATDPVLIPVLLVLAGYCLAKHGMDILARHAEMQAIKDQGLVAVPVVISRASGGAGRGGGLFARVGCDVQYSFDVYTQDGQFVRRQ
jgi:hypothetical protein